MERKRILSGSPYEPIVGHSRVLAVGRQVFVSGTTAVSARGQEDVPPDAYNQTRRCLQIIVDALREAGAEPRHVVRTRIYHTRPKDFEEIARAHKELLGDVGPTSTIVLVAAFTDPRWLVEVEADAIIDS
jgi:enamine deaminase RidA (YjgF/YER057c/UK114 family)